MRVIAPRQMAATTRAAAVRPHAPRVELRAHAARGIPVRETARDGVSRLECRRRSNPPSRGERLRSSVIRQAACIGPCVGDGPLRVRCHSAHHLREPGELAAGSRRRARPRDRDTSRVGLVTGATYSTTDRRIARAHGPGHRTRRTVRTVQRVRRAVLRATSSFGSASTRVPTYA